MDISIVIPAYNESAAIVAVVEEILMICRASGLENAEIIVVDDGSDDMTAELAAQAGATVVRHPHNIGYGRSLKDGITAAKHDTIVITDADLTYPFEEVPRLLSEYQKGFDMVVGARTGKYYHESIFKSPLRKILKFLVEFASERKIPDINSGLRIFSRKSIMPFFPHLCDTFSFTTSTTLAYMMKGKFVSYFEIPYKQRAGKTKVRLFRDSLRTLRYILQVMNYYNPLKIFLLFVFFCLAGSFVFFLLGFILQLRTLFLLGTGSALVALLSLGLGLIADLLKQIMDK